MQRRRPRPRFSKLHLVAADVHAAAVLDPNSTNRDESFRFIAHIVVYAQASNPKLPRRLVVRPKGLSVPRPGRGLVCELDEDLVENPGAVASIEPGKMIPSILRVLDSIAHSEQPLPAPTVPDRPVRIGPIADAADYL